MPLTLIVSAANCIEYRTLPSLSQIGQDQVAFITDGHLFFVQTNRYQFILSSFAVRAEVLLFI